MRKQAMAGGMEFLVRMMIPAECYIWLDTRRPFLLLLIRLAVLFLMAAPCVLGVTLGAFCIFESHGSNDMIRDGTLAIAVPVAGVALITWVIRTLLHRFWKPTPDMLAQNDEAVAADMRGVDVTFLPEHTAQEVAEEEAALDVLRRATARAAETDDDRRDA